MTKFRIFRCADHKILEEDLNEYMSEICNLVDVKFSTSSIYDSTHDEISTIYAAMVISK